MANQNGNDVVEAPAPRNPLLALEDWWAVWFGAMFIAAAIVAAWTGWPMIPKFGSWETNPLVALPGARIVAVAILLLVIGAVTSLGVAVMKGSAGAYAKGFVVVAVFAVIAQIVAKQESVNYYGLEYVLWALVLGLIVANTVGTPAWILAGARSELFIKTGLVLMGAEILASNVVKLGIPGIIVAWVVTPISVLFMFIFGTRVLRLRSKSLAMVIACCTSVCGVSAAIASAAACRAKKEELTLAIGITMVFTVIMMIAMPAVARLMGLGEFIGGAWIGGTVDSTGAVVASGALLGPVAEQVASVVKMVQNALIGLIAFVIAVYWVSVVERDPDAPRPSIAEIWIRFPKFILGFVGASLLFSFIVLPTMGSELVDSATAFTKGLRGWFFALAFASIGLESNFRELAAQLVGGKPIVLYIVGQSFNILLTLLAAWLAFGGILLTVPEI